MLFLNLTAQILQIKKKNCSLRIFTIYLCAWINECVTLVILLLSGVLQWLNSEHDFIDVPSDLPLKWIESFIDFTFDIFQRTKAIDSVWDDTRFVTVFRLKLFYSCDSFEMNKCDLFIFFSFYVARNELELQIRLMEMNECKLFIQSV